MMRKLIVMESKTLSYTKIRKGDLNGDQEVFDKISEKISTKYKNLLMFDDVKSLYNFLL